MAGPAESPGQGSRPRHKFEAELEPPLSEQRVNSCQLDRYSPRSGRELARLNRSTPGKSRLGRDRAVREQPDIRIAQSRYP